MKVESPKDLFPTWCIYILLSLCNIEWGRDCFDDEERKQDLLYLYLYLHLCFYVCVYLYVYLLLSLYQCVFVMTMRRGSKILSHDPQSKGRRFVAWLLDPFSCICIYIYFSICINVYLHIYLRYFVCYDDEERRGDHLPRPAKADALLRDCKKMWDRGMSIPDICHQHHQRCLWRTNLSCGEIFPCDRLSCGEVSTHDKCSVGDMSSHGK